MGDLWYLALAYGVIWIVLLAYLYSIARRQDGLREEMKSIQAALEEGTGAEEEGDEAEPFLSLVRGQGSGPAGNEGPESPQ
jgi:CcmD family protein